MSIQSQTLLSFKWSFIDVFLKYFLTFFIGIILARILSPSDFGLVGLSSIFIAISRVFIDGGFSDALIRKTNCTRIDYSTVFVFNLALAILFYVILFFCSSFIGRFFNKPELIDILKVASLGLLINAVASIQSIALKKSLNFKLIAIIGFISTVFSGTIAVAMAYKGFGVWSLIASGIIQGVTATSLLWFVNEQKIGIQFDFRIFKEHFRFGSRVMAGSLVHVIHENMYFGLVGKTFNSEILGYYYRADNFQKLFSNNIDTVVRQVTYPILSKLQNDSESLQIGYIRLIRMINFVNCVVILGLFLVAEPLIVLLIGGKWLPSVPYLKMLCFVGLFFPLISINANILNVKGRSDLSFKLIGLKVLFSIPALALGYFAGIYAMIIGMYGALLLNYFLAMRFTSSIIGYKVGEQIRDIWSGTKVVLMSYAPVFLASYFLNLSSLYSLIFQVILGCFLLIIFCEYSKNKEYSFLKNLIMRKIGKGFIE